MASVSYGLNHSEMAQMAPEYIHVGSLAITTYNVELRVDKTKGLTNNDVLEILRAFMRRLEDSHFDDLRSQV